MSDVLAIAAQGMVNGLERLNTISHNLANSSTTGYKKDISVSHLFTKQISGLQKSAVIGHENGRLSRTMAQLNSVMDIRSGNPRITNNPLDVAIEGNGFFQVRTSEGIRYTRAGSLSLDEMGRVVTSQGHIVEGESGEIRLTSDNPRITKSGEIWDGEYLLGQLKLVKFENPNSLQKQGEGLLAASEMGQPADSVRDYQIHQGHIEASNVDMMEEMVGLIETMRTIESTQKVIQGYDEMISTALSTIAEV